MSSQAFNFTPPDAGIRNPFAIPQPPAPPIATNRAVMALMAQIQQLEQVNEALTNDGQAKAIEQLENLVKGLEERAKGKDDSLKEFQQKLRNAETQHNSDVQYVKSLEQQNKDLTWSLNDCQAKLAAQPQNTQLLAQLQMQEATSLQSSDELQKEIFKLSEHNEILLNTTNELNDMCSSLATQNVQMEDIVEAAELEKSQLVNIVKARNSERQRLGDIIKAHESEHQRLGDIINAVASEKLRLEDKVKAHESEYQRLGDIIKALESEKQRLEKDFKWLEEQFTEQEQSAKPIYIDSGAQTDAPSRNEIAVQTDSPAVVEDVATQTDLPSVGNEIATQTDDPPLGNDAATQTDGSADDTIKTLRQSVSSVWVKNRLMHFENKKLQKLFDRPASYSDRAIQTGTSQVVSIGTQTRDIEPQNIPLPPSPTWATTFPPPSAASGDVQTTDPVATEPSPPSTASTGVQTVEPVAAEPSPPTTALTIVQTIASVETEPYLPPHLSSINIFGSFYIDETKYFDWVMFLWILFAFFILSTIICWLQSFQSGGYGPFGYGGAYADDWITRYINPWVYKTFLQPDASYFLGM